MLKEIDVLFNRFGKPIFRLLPNGRIVTFSGKSKGFLVGDNLYNYKGKHTGWYSGGLIRDHRGNIVGFGENVTDSTHPFLPYKQYKPYPSYVEYEPYRPYLQHEPYRPYKMYGWSNIPLENIFD